MGISEALRLTLRARSTTKQVNIFTANQAAILSIQRPQLQVFLHWIPAWAGGSGAEKADTLAKEATRESAGIHVAEPATPAVARPVAKPTRAEPTTPTVARTQDALQAGAVPAQTIVQETQATPVQAALRAALGPAPACPIYRLQSVIKRIIKKECLLDWRKE
ncbi:hypothetical protein B7463_g9557, partial [Scytalidium lignicola]